MGLSARLWRPCWVDSVQYTRVMKKIAVCIKIEIIVRMFREKLTWS